MPKGDGGGGLVLSRKIGEKLIIGDVITVEVVELRGGRARLRIVAPRDIPIHREEIVGAPGVVADLSGCEG